MTIGSGNETIVEYFLSELNGLRNRASDFARDNPKVANELLLGSGYSDDPHVELLLQSFAYLTGRLRYDLDADLPEVSANLVRYLYPHLEAPTPPMAVIQLDLQQGGSNFESGYLVPKGKLLRRSVRSSDNNEYDCVFSVAYETTLWPVKLERRLVPINDDELAFVKTKYLDCRSAVKVCISSLKQNEPLSTAMKSLRFFVDCGRTDSQSFYDLHQNLVDVVAVRQVGSDYRDSRLGIRWLGFDDADAVLPYKKCSHRAYRLLQEYFSFPEKYLFFELTGIDVPKETTELEVFFLFDQDITQIREYGEAQLRINCAPAINLYRSVTDPINPDERTFENLLVPDANNYRGLEIHSVEKVVATDVQGRSRVISPFLRQEQIGRTETTDIYWSTRRDFTERMDLPGTQSFISFHDREHSPTLLTNESVHAEVLVTNRDIAESLKVGTRLQALGAGPFERVVLVTKASRHRTPNVRGVKPWLLLSQLSLNFSSLSSDLETIKKLLRLYASSRDLEQQRLIDSLRGMKSKPSVRRIGEDAWRGFCQGVTVTIVIDEKRLGVTSLHLFGEVLSRFLALYASANSFVKLVFESEQTQRVLKEWPPMVGEKVLL